MKAWPTILFLVLAMLVDASLTGCASCRQRSETSAYQGPMQAPEENLLWWELLGFFLVPTAEVLSSQP